MPILVNIAGQVGQIKLPTTKALWPLFETIINSIQSLEDSDVDEKKIVIEAMRPEDIQYIAIHKIKATFHKIQTNLCSH